MVARWKRLAYCSRSPIKVAGWNPIEIFVINADGGNSRMVTREPNNTAEPSWSPDGGKIAFIRVVDGVLLKNSIFSIDVDGNKLGRITSVLAEDHCPQWSPDGNSIAFQSNRDGNNEIYVMTAR